MNQTAFSSTTPAHETQRFLEQFGYTIIASQLLNEQPAPSYTSAAASARFSDIDSHNDGRLTVPSFDELTLSPSVPVSDTPIPLVTPCYLIYAARSVLSSNSPQSIAGRIFIAIIAVILLRLVSLHARRLWLRNLRRTAVSSARIIVSNSQGFDVVASVAVKLVQETEVVTRGYRLSCPLPPVSRLDKFERPNRFSQPEAAHGRRANKHCYRLRETLVEAFTESIKQHLIVIGELQAQRVCSTEDVRKYYEIYDVSVDDLNDTDASVENAGPGPPFMESERTSLHALRVLFSRAYMVRKAALCCILAIPATCEIGDIAKWTGATEAMRKLAHSTGKCLAKVKEVLSQDGPSMLTPPISPAVPLNLNDENGTSDKQRAQLRQVNGLSQRIRGVHLKMNVIREETQQLSRHQQSDIPPQSPSTANSSLVTMYESVGADLRELLEEWESGRSLLLQHSSGNNNTSSTPISRSSSPVSSRFFERPQSSSSIAGSLSGTTAFSGEGESEDKEKLIFEAVSVGRRGSLRSNNGGSAHNQEVLKKRVEKMREERKTREEGRKKSDMSRHMLRELSMVIKMRDIHGEGPPNDDSKGRKQDGSPVLPDARPTVDSPVPIVPLPVEIEREKRDRRSI